MASSNPRLAASTSPYLRAHADNPVAWYPWGAEAFEEAARRGVPVLVSIGYSTCHWCHVMARESFADPEVAAQLSAGFVAIKVDREEHPDVDSAYLQAASAFTPNLGWPLTAFATPAGRVFYAGTYFPPEARGGMPSFRQVLDAVTEAWTLRRGEVEQTAAGIAEAMHRAAEPGQAGTLPGLDGIAEAVRTVVADEDRAYGGFGPGTASMSTPKFPVAPLLRLLQTRAVAPLVPEASAVASRALSAMRSSPLFDPVDGGFFRYATRRDWTEPHYERMLTDNAGLIEVALAAGDLDTARRVSRFLIDVLQQPAGGFAGAQDSESWIDGERSEGGYYARSAEDRAVLAPPAIDGKVVTGWNGMAIGALATAGLRLADPDLVAAARRAADAVLETNVAADGTLLRASLDEIPSRASAVLEDSALLAAGLLDLALASGEPRYAVVARDLVDRAVDAGAGGRDAVLDAQGIPVSAAATDSDHPSGPAALVAAALRLWLIGAGDRYRKAATDLVAADIGAALVEPRAYGTLLAAAATLAGSARQLVVVGDVDSPLAAAARALSTDVLAVVTEAQATAFAAAGLELFEAKHAHGAAATAYDCRDFVCRLPTTDPTALTP